jgi:hypothetical protein
MSQPQTTIETVKQRMPLAEKSFNTDNINYQKPLAATKKGLTVQQNGSGISTSHKKKKQRSKAVVQTTLAPSQYQTRKFRQIDYLFFVLF